MAKLFKAEFFLALLTVLGLSCGKRPVGVDGRMYIDNKNNFKMEFPAGWSVDSSGYLGTAVIFISKSESEAFRPNIQVVIQKNSELPLGEYAEYAKANMAKLFEGYSFISFTGRSLNGLDAKVLEYSFLQEDTGRIRQRQYMLSRKNTVYVITCSAAETDFGVFAKDFEISAGSFNFITGD